MHKRADPDGIVRKASSNGRTLGGEFVISDDSVDRYGDVIDQSGWLLKHFKGNPIALFNHNSNAPIGTWSNVRQEGGRTLGRLHLAEDGTSERINEIRSLVEQDILRAVSVGFRPIKSEPIKDKTGYRFIENDLLEVSLVSVPANAHALQVAKALNTSDDTISLVFGEQAGTDDGIRRRGTPGEHAAIPPSSRKNPMTTLAERIVNLQNELNAKKDKLAELNDADAYDADAIEEMTARIGDVERELEGRKASEAKIGLVAKAAAPAPIDSRRPFAIPAKKVEPKDYVYRALAARVKAVHEMRNPLEVLRENYGEDEGTRAVFDVVNKAASAPAMTTTTGWAAELVQTAILDFVESLMPNSVYPRLSSIGGRFTFGQNGIVSLPVRSATPTLAGSFVLQGNPIPVRQGAFTATTLTPKKMAVITTLTREMAEHSTPALEGVLRQAIQEDTSVAIDTVLLDATAISTTRPAGLRNGVTVTTATSGGGFAALVGDVKGLLGALITASAGQLRQPVFIMNPIQAIAISLTQNAGGDFPFADGIASGMLQGYPVIQSTTVTAGMVIVLDAADFFSATGDEPRFTVSDTATLHMEDTSPLAIGTAGSPNTVAAPVRSLFQTDSMAIRMIMDLNWALRRVGTLAWTQSVTW